MEENIIMKTSLRDVNKKLNVVEMEKTIASRGFWGGVCTSVYIGTMFFPHPVLVGASVGCLLYDAYK
ncbi:hypothetical protein [Flavobacterium sp. XS2P14]|uniref:hypothetical protein n=1 Tax=Flavobacterium sp. XS2P14 TaxID=3401735 RepID=UPI003AACD495